MKPTILLYFRCLSAWKFLLLVSCYLIPGSGSIAAQSHETSYTEHIPASASDSPIRGRVFEIQKKIYFKTEQWTKDGVMPWRVHAAGDFNADGRTDLIALEPASSAVQLLLSQSGNTFAARTPLILPRSVRPSRLLALHIDHDARQDLFAWDPQARIGWLGHTQADGTFLWHDHVREFFDKDADLAHPVAIDVDGDGLSEIFCRKKDDPEPGLSSLGALSKSIDAAHPFIRYLLPSENVQYSTTGEVAADVDGNGLDELVSIGLDKTVLSLRYHPESINDSRRLDRNWAEFHSLNRFIWSPLFTGDFDGDGRGDILAYSDNISPWWMVRSGGNYGIVESLPSLIFGSPPPRDIIVGDFNGDGLDDVLLNSTGGEIFQIAASRRSKPIAGTTIISDKGECTNSGEDGSFVLQRDAGYIMVFDDRFRFFQPVFKVSHARRLVKFLGLAADSAAATFGASLSPFGDPADGPYICLGYNNDRYPAWNRLSATRCPEQYAAVELSDVNHFYFSCCRMPFADVLVEEIVEAETTCPENFVIVGARFLPKEERTKHREQMSICQKINILRYKLGPPRPGIYWGVGSTIDRGQRLDYRQLPVGLREHIDRLGSDGCLGIPPGSLLVEKGGKNCNENTFRELLYSGLPGDPPAGTPVVMFPDCHDISDALDPAAGCLKQ